MGGAEVKLEGAAGPRLQEQGVGSDCDAWLCRVKGAGALATWLLGSPPKPGPAKQETLIHRPDDLCPSQVNCLTGKVEIIMMTPCGTIVIHLADAYRAPTWIVGSTHRCPLNE